jgi:hypothetical protein
LLEGQGNERQWLVDLLLLTRLINFWQEPVDAGETWNFAERILQVNDVWLRQKVKKSKQQLDLQSPESQVYRMILESVLCSMGAYLAKLFCVMMWIESGISSYVRKQSMNLTSEL